VDGSAIEVLTKMTKPFTYDAVFKFDFRNCFFMLPKYSITSVLIVLCPAFFIALLPAIFTSQSHAQTRQAVMPEKHVAVFKKYCYECHDSASQEAGVDLEAIPFVVSTDIQTAERWSKILNAINSGEMPPKDSRQISAADKTGFLTDLSNKMVTARKILSDSGGVITMRRLNRREYQNTLEALLGVRPDISKLPDDQASSDFDTSGASLFFSSDQFEAYFETAKDTLRLAMRPSRNRRSETKRVEPEKFYRSLYLAAGKEMKDLEKRAADYFAQDKKPPSDFGFLDDYQVKKQRVQEWLPLMEAYVKSPETETGATLIMTIKQGGMTKVKLPALGPSDDGEYTIRLRAAHYPDAEKRFHYVEFTEGSGKSRKRLGWRKVTGTLKNPQVIEFPYVHHAGTKQQVWIHQRTHQDRGDKNLATEDMKTNGVGTVPGVWIDWAEIVGPHSGQPSNKISSNKKSKKSKKNRKNKRNRSLPASKATYGSAELLQKISPVEILFDKPKGWSDEKYAKEVFGRFCVRAFRGKKPSAEFLKRLVKLYSNDRAGGIPEKEALVGSLAVVLSSPSFLYMVESTGDESSPELSANELAVRLSYLLWSAPPDEELMRLATNGRLLDATVLQQQTDRLLADVRSDRFVESFVHQWLEMDRLGMFQFLGLQFPTFDNAVRESSREEIFQTFRLMMKERLPLKTLLKSDFVVINDLLADYYGIPDVVGHEFRKVSLPKRTLRGGLLGTAAVLAMGSDGIRSSPVERGAWVLRHLVNDPPPPAPPNVPRRTAMRSVPSKN